MSGHGEFPPPGAGAGAPEPTQPRYPAPGQPQGAWPAPYQPPPGWRPPGPAPMGAAHKPGALPLRPLGLSDMYDATFKIIRFNPKATVGSAVLVAAVSMAIPVLITGGLSLAVDLSFDASSSGEPTAAQLAGLIGAGGSLLLGTFLQSIGLILVTGMIARVCAAAAIGRRLGLVEAWGETRGKRWRLVGLTLLLALLLMLVVGAYAATWVPVVLLSDQAWPIVLYGLVSVPLFLAFMCWFWIRVYYLPVPALMLEDVGILVAIGRGFTLTRRQFWRTFGIALLTVIVAQVAGSMLSMPISFLGQGALAAGAPSESAIFLLVLSQAASSVVAAAFVSPFTATMTSLQYLDQRMRKEAYDVELMTRAGIRVT
ncbi:hypothetical protein [Nocardioides sp. LHG3406-4]|uniref:hypothetical protein n=1 Tax=Nocardioides sp. LHG3406-4 TaxID=2804575 RepID=UPI003CE670EB